MEVVSGALPSAITKLGDLLIGEYNLQKGVKGEIRFLKSELESMQGVLEKVSNTPLDQLDIQDKIWARDLRELSYDIEDSIDTFMVHSKGNESTKLHGIKKFINQSVGLFTKAKIRHGIATEIRDIKSRVTEVHERHHRYKVNHGANEPVITTVDPHLLVQYTDVKELVGIDEARDEVISKITKEDSEVSMQQGKVVSIVGFGGLGKTTLANAVFEKIRTRFDCCAFVSVSQTPDLKKVFKGLLSDLGRTINEETMDERRLISLLRDFLHVKRYFIVIDDIWDISVWKMIRYALPDNDIGYTIITTTRIYNVAEQVGGPYKLNPLSLSNSRKLLYRRIFGNENNEDMEKCPDEELGEVSNRILKKCAGVPLAIITMASLLACRARSKLEWYEVYNSIGTGLENNLDVDNMRKILSFSYYELPPYLRTCLLYLSMFPEDYEIQKSRLIWMWIAEGFVKCEKKGKNLFELGESYFNELINRSMVQPIHHGYTDMVTKVRVHDMVLDLIRSLSSDVNFVTILNGKDHTLPSNTIRRLSFQDGNDDHAVPWATRSLQQVRSAIFFPYSVELMPAFGSFRVLRVLELRSCNSQSYSLKYLGDLFHLRYLGLHDTGITQLPEEIGNLQFLQTLDISGNRISSLPVIVFHLKNLMCLYIEPWTRVPNGIGRLTLLHELLWLYIDNTNMDNIEELAQLTELRVLKIALDEWSDKLGEGLCKLQKIRFLCIHVLRTEPNVGGLDAWITPRNLCELYTRCSCWSSTLPAWLDPTLLQQLSVLCIGVRKLQQDDVEILGRLPALLWLDLEVDHENLGILTRLTVGAHSFPCLLRCELRRFAGPVIFGQGAMPRLRTLWLWRFPVRLAIEIDSIDGGWDMYLGNLQSLQEVMVDFRYDGASKEVKKQVEAMVWHAIEMHPNHPILYLDNLSRYVPG